MRKFRSIFAVVLVLVICAAVLTGCVRKANVAAPVIPEKPNTNETAVNEEKTYIPKTNVPSEKANEKAPWIGDDWEVVIAYDASGVVTEVFAYNDDTFQKESYSGYEGGDYNAVVGELLTAIEEAGYYVDDVDYEKSHVTIDISSYKDLDDRYYWD